MDTKGGRFTMSVGGNTISGRGAAKIKPARASRAAGVNQDASGYSTVEPKLASIELSFDRGKGLRWDERMMLEEVNVTFKEDDVGLTHMFTRANWVGEPEIDSSSGEVTGVSLSSDKYQSY